MAPTLNDLHIALGEFLTECGRVEFTMLLFVDVISEAPIEHLFDEYSPLTFGGKIKWFRKWCEFSGVVDDKKELLEEVYQQLDELLPKRNYLVHGETWEGTFKGQPNQPYRVGVIRDNLEYLDEFDRGEHGENVFSLEQVRKAVALCQDIRSDLDVLRQADSSEE
jgi:hypothetical protein